MTRWTVEIGRHGGFDLIEEAAELGGAVAAIAVADDPAGGNVEGGEQRGRAMAFVVMAAPRRPGRGAAAACGWLRSSAWICDFSSTHSTMAWSGGDI